MPILKGKWYFKETLDLASIETAHSHYAEQDFFCVDGTNYRYLHFSNNSAHSVIYGLDEVFPYYMGEYWYSNSYRKIEFIYPIEIDEDFYNWFTKNAVNLQPTGTWRFNKTLTDPGTVLYSHAHGGTVIGTAHDTEIGSSQITHISYDPSIYLAVYDIEGDGYNIWYDGSWYSEEARVITFIDQNLVSLNPEFALWFYENAHSMELKLYSECYIAEAVDTIRSITGTTKGYTVKDLSVGIEEVKAAAQKLTNYGTWRFNDDIDSYTWTSYINNHNTGAFEYDYNRSLTALTFEVAFSTADLLDAEGIWGGGDTTETTEFKVMEFHNNGDEGCEMNYYTDNTYGSEDVLCANIGDDGSFYTEAARTITLHEEPSAELLDFLNTFATEINNSECKHQQKTVNPSASTQVVTPDSGYGGLSSVTVNACSGTAYISSTASVSAVGKASARISSTEINKIIPSNIKSGVNILGVTGTYSGSAPQTCNVELYISAYRGADYEIHYMNEDGTFATYSNSISTSPGYQTINLTVQKNSLLALFIKNNQPDFSLGIYDGDDGLKSLQMINRTTDTNSRGIVIYKVLNKDYAREELGFTND